MLFHASECLRMRECKELYMRHAEPEKRRVDIREPRKIKE